MPVLVRSRVSGLVSRLCGLVRGGRNGVSLTRNKRLVAPGAFEDYADVGIRDVPRDGKPQRF